MSFSALTVCGLAPSYLSDLVVSYIPSCCSTGSQNTGFLSVPGAFSCCAHFVSMLSCLSLSLSPIVCVCPSLLFVWGLSSFQVSMVERRSCGSGSIYQATPKAAQHPPGSVLLTYVFNNLHASLFLSSEFVDIVLSFSLSIVYTWHLLHLSILGEGSLVCCADCKAPCGKLWFWAL